MPVNAQLAEAIQFQLARVGITMKIEVYETGVVYPISRISMTYFRVWLLFAPGQRLDRGLVSNGKPSSNSA